MINYSSIESRGFGKTLSMENIRSTVSPDMYSWRGHVSSKLQDLIKLNDGWDGYNAGPVSFTLAHFAMNMLEAICKNDTPVPQIVPGVNGDLQIEWHMPSSDIELHVISANKVVAWRCGSSGEEETLNLQTEFSAIAPWIEELTEENIVTAA